MESWLVGTEPTPWLIDRNESLVLLKLTVFSFRKWDEAQSLQLGGGLAPAAEPVGVLARVLTLWRPGPPKQRVGGPAVLGPVLAPGMGRALPVPQPPTGIFRARPGEGADPAHPWSLPRPAAASLSICSRSKA